MIVFGRANAQSYSYSYTDPCNGNTKTLSVPINGAVAVSYYGQVQNFTYNEITNGALENWASSIYSQYGGNNPCASIVGLPTAINITQGTVYNTIGILNTLSMIADVASVAGSTNMLSGTVGTIGNAGSGDNQSGDKKSNNSSSNSNTNSTTQGSTTQGTTANGGSSNNGSNGNQTTNGNNSNGNVPGNNGGNGSNSGTPNTNGGSSTTPAQTQGNTPGNAGSTGGAGTTGNGSTTNSGSGSTGSQGTNGTTGSGSGENGSGSGTTNPSSNTNNTTTEEGKGSTNITAGATNTVRADGAGGSSDESNKGNKSPGNSKEGGKPQIIASSDFVGFNFRNSEVTKGLKATGGYTALRWDGQRASGVLADYTSAQNGPNITGYYAYIKPKATTLISLTATFGFEGIGSQYATVAFGQMRSFKSKKFKPLNKLKVVYMATASMGYVYREPFLGTATIAGGMYDFKIGKRLDIKLLNLLVYSPYVSYYNDIVLKSPFVMLPSVGTNIGITKRFKFNINVGGAWAIKAEAMNYTVTMGTRLML
jgi:hypothetical protein